MILGSAVFGIYIYFSIGFNELSMVFQSLNIYSFLFYFGLSFATMLLVMLFWAISWLILLRALAVKISLRKTFLYYVAGDFIDQFVPSPGVAGEVTRAFFVKRETRITYGLVAVAGITNRIVAYGAVMGGLSVGILFLVLTRTIPTFASGLLLAVWIGVVTLFIILSFVSLREDAATKLAYALIRLLRFFKRNNVEKWSERIFIFLSRFREGFKFFGANPHFLVGPIIFNVLSFVLNFVVYILVFYSLGLNNLPIDFFIVVFILAGAIQDGVAGFSVGGLEILLTNIFILYGIPPATSGVAAVVVRSVTFYFPLILGYAFLQIIGAKNLLNYKTLEEVEAEE
jgi:glycosyltransferase 2 family protein